jgi:hypothetical protein
LPNYYTLLLDHAIRLRANVVWELAKPFDMRALTSLARSFGYRVEALVLATPLMESWISTLRRETLHSLDRDKLPVRVSLEKITSCFARWPSHLAWAEDLHVFDKVQVINRQGEVFFENRLIEDKGKLRWSETPFAFESLVLERLHACNRDQVDCLISEWQTLRADPDIALQNHLAWPWSSFTDTGARLQELRDDPSTRFSLLNPDQSVNIDARKGWIARLQEDLIAIQMNAEDEGAITLGPRCERLLTLVNSV